MRLSNEMPAASLILSVQVLKIGGNVIQKTLLLLLAFAFLTSCSSDEAGTITIVQPLETNIIDTDTICLTAEDLDQGQKKGYTRTSSYLLNEMSSGLGNYGIEYLFYTGDSSLKMIAKHKEKWLPIVGGRHFNLHFKHISYINIQIINNDTGGLIGEVEYRRPRLAGPEVGIVPQMIDMLIDERGPKKIKKSISVEGTGGL